MYTHIYIYICIYIYIYIYIDPSMGRAWARPRPMCGGRGAVRPRGRGAVRRGRLREGPAPGGRPARARPISIGNR